jgi:decaprenylphospho-beta-D-ribofuranose 2-oxidase
MAKQTGLSGWGRTFVPGREVRSENLPAVTRNAVLTRGLGRSYGDASLPPANTLELAGSTLADRILGFDADTGVLRAEAGLVLSDMNRLFLPRGFFTPVTPGTRFVTLGGMVASDVHGKNHHVDGTIGRHVQRLLVQTATGRIIECSREHEPELFLATLGGMGLTGHILEVQLKLHKVPSPWIYRESYKIDNLDELLVKLKEAGKQWPFTVAWIDTIATGKNLGRGILYVGRWAEKNEAPDSLPKPQQHLLTMPFALPSGLLNRFTIAMFNRLVYYAHTKPQKQDICDPDTFFYPLDKVGLWNRAYGAAGVTQHQAVIPDEAGAAGVRRLIELLAETGQSSFLSVIKDCGPEGDGLISFPRPGMSLALDIPITSRTQEVIDRLNRHVLDCGGRIYLTKDGFTKREDFRAMEPRLDAFLAVKAKWDPDSKIHSALSDRLFGPPRASEEDDDEELVERASQAFARAEYEREERARGVAVEQLATSTASTAAIGLRPPLEVSATAAGVGPEAPTVGDLPALAATEPALPAAPIAPMPVDEPASAALDVAALSDGQGSPAAASEDAQRGAVQSAPPVAVGTPAPEPERPSVESTAPVFKPERTLIGPGPASSIPPSQAQAHEPAQAEPPAKAEEEDDDVELEQVHEPVKSSVPPPVPAAASSRPPAIPMPSFPPPSGRLSVPPPPARTLDAARRLSVPAPPTPSVVPGAPSVPPAAPASSPPRSPSDRPGFGKATLVGIPALVVPGQAPKGDGQQAEKPDGTRDNAEDQKA